MEQYSWNQLSENRIVKTLDYSSFRRGSGIPQAFYGFFNINTENKEDIHLILLGNDNSFKAIITWTRPDSPVRRVFWGQDFTNLLKQNFPNWETVKPHDKNSQMGLVFNKTNKENVYKVSFNQTSSEMVFGHINGTYEGQVFANREELGLSGIHAPPMHGIWGRQKEGSASIVLSGGYADDVDEWDYILYTGQGGQDAPGGKQIKDQEFTLGNRGLQLNKEYNLPVRVTRGYQLEEGPEQGYRYDGLYYVTDYERVKGKEGYLICRFHLQRENSTSEEEIEQPTSPADRAPHTVNRIVRNVKFAEQIKELYNNTCQVCNVFLKTPTDGLGISVAAHIKGLGKPHNGPDIKENMLCLCPNHHAQFDSYSFYISPENFEIVGLDGFEGKSITTIKKHKIKTEYLEYHQEQYLKIN